MPEWEKMFAEGWPKALEVLDQKSNLLRDMLVIRVIHLKENRFDRVTN
jgi:hypothetical protein